MTEAEADQLAQIREALGRGNVNLEFGPVFNLTKGTTLPSVVIKVPHDTATRRTWKRVGPVILPPADGPQTRAALVKMLAGLMDEG